MTLKSLNRAEFFEAKNPTSPRLRRVLLRPSSPTLDKYCVLWRSRITPTLIRINVSVKIFDLRVMNYFLPNKRYAPYAAPARAVKPIQKVGVGRFTSTASLSELTNLSSEDSVFVLVLLIPCEYLYEP